MTNTHSVLTDFSRLSLNQITTENWSLPEAVAGCVRHGIPYIAPWRHKVSATGLAECAKVIRESGLKLSSLCRGGMFPAAAAQERQERIDDNLRAIDEAVELGANVLVLVCGAAPDRDIDGARTMIAEGIAKIVSHARERGVKLGIEPLHPMFAADRSAITTLGEANKLAAQFAPDEVGVVVDVFHVWWDAQVYSEIERAKGRILGFHVSDWLVPLPDVLLGRGMMGDGVIELRRLRAAVEAAGYNGPIEVEIFNRKIWDTPGDKVLAQMKERYLECV
ncbi:MAG TPA: sugar phosphate isomerase/epimerase family protein [Blastocatellia bacterium]|nr:sugar phosphate isomerase/epimerase family protein [Blastocatellia bacterium]